MTKKIILIFSLLLTLSGQAQSADQLLDRIVAVVGQNVITQSQLIDHARVLYAKLRQANVQPLPSQDAVVGQALNELITQQLELEQAKRLGINADQNLVAEAIKSVAQNNNLTVPQLRQALKSEGMDFSQFQTRIRNELIRQRLISSEVANKIQISKGEVDQELAKLTAAARKDREVELLHILIPVGKDASQAKVKAAEKLAVELRKRIDQGADFRALAKKYSAGPHASNGGNTGWLKISNLPKQFGQLIDSMHTGQVEGPFRGDQGFHIIKAAAFRDQAEQPKMIEQTHVEHILIRTNEVTSGNDAKQRLEQLRERALQGANFATLARANSEDQASAIKGGDLGWINPGAMVPEFESVMNNTAVGAISQPFKTRFGWDMLKVLGRRKHDESSEALRIEARKVIMERKLKQATQNYLQRLRGETYIKLYPQPSSS